MNDVRITHLYPQANALTQALGGHGISVLHTLLQHSQTHDDHLLATVSLRQLCIDVPASKDTINRRLRQLQTLGVIERLALGSGPFTGTTYVLHLQGHGIQLAS